MYKCTNNRRDDMMSATCIFLFPVYMYNTHICIYIYLYNSQYMNIYNMHVEDRESERRLIV